MISYHGKITLTLSLLKYDETLVSDFFTKCSDTHAYNTRAASSGNYVIAKMRTEKGKQAFQKTGAKVWNEPPDHIRRAPSIEIFKEKMRKMILED